MKRQPGLLVLLALLSHTSRASLDTGSELKLLLEAALERHLPARGGRERRQVESAEPGAVMYLPLGGNSNVRSQILTSPLDISAYLATGIDQVVIDKKIENNRSLSPVSQGSHPAIERLPGLVSKSIINNSDVQQQQMQQPSVLLR